MSLQVWLPLTGHLNNQGLSNVTVTNNGATVDNSGKLGKCYSFNGSSSRIYANNVSIANSEMTACCWVKFLSAPSLNTYPYAISLGYDNKTYGTEHQIGISWWKTSSSNTIHICGNGSELDSGFVPDLNTWYHLCFTYEGSTSKLYVNGNLYYTGTNANTPKTRTNLCIGARSASASGAGASIMYPLNALINDVRIYDHALNAKEVKELSKGLVLHYPLSSVNNTLLPFGYEQLEYIESAGNAYINTEYKFNPEVESFEVGYKSNVTSHSGMILATAVGASSYFWLYYYGSSGLRIYSKAPSSSSPQENIIGASNDLVKHIVKYKNKHMYVDGMDKGSLSSTYTQISNNLFLFSDSTSNAYTFKGRIYYCYIYDENGKAQRIYIPAKRISDSAIGMYDIINNTFSVSATSTAFTAGSTIGVTTTFYDVSGYNYHGSKLGNIGYSKDSARYNISTDFNGTDNGILIENLQISNVINTAVTYSFWIKPNGENGARSVYFGSYTGTTWSVEKTTSNILRLYWNGSPDETCSGATITDGVWQHICITKQGTNDIKVYINGVQKWSSTATHSNLTFPTTYRIGRDTRSGDGTPYKGLMSDFRIYATALSAEDVKQLYNTAAALCNNGTLMAYSFNET